MAYSDCDVNNLTYHTCKHIEKIFNNSVMAISTNLNRAFDITCPCAICGQTGQSFDGCEELRDQAVIQKSYIQLRLALQKFKGIAASQGHDVNSFRVYKLSYVNSIDLHQHPSVPLDPVAADCLDKVEGLLVKTIKLAGQGLLVKAIKFANQTNRKLNFLTSKFAVNEEEADNDDDNDEDSQSSLNDCTIQDFLRGAQS